MADVRRLVELGPRPVGSEAHEKAVELIVNELKKLPLETEIQRFTAVTPTGPMEMKNVIARQGGSPSLPVILLASHYDTMPTDRFSFVGANDGGSSTGLLLELARGLAARKSDFQYWFVFFDGEEAIRQWTDSDSLYGSREFVRQLKAAGHTSRMKALVLLDMIGDKDLDLKRDSSSTPWLVDLFWNTAKAGKHPGFTSEIQSMMDDHTPFAQEGIPVIDLIDFDYGPGGSYWHSPEDTLDKLSAESLRHVGAVVVESLPALERTLTQQGANK